MNQDSKNLIKYMGVLFLLVLLSYKVPYDSYSVIQYIIPPIEIKKSRIYISGIIQLMLFFIALRGLFNLDRFTSNNKLVIFRKFMLFLIVIILVLPSMNLLIDLARTNYHWARGHRLKALDIENSDMRSSLNETDNELSISFRMEVKDYGRGRNEFRVRVHLPESLGDYIGKDFYDLNGPYRTYGPRNKRVIDQTIIIELDEENVKKDLYEYNWIREDVIYELYNNEEKVEIIQRGL